MENNHTSYICLEDENIRKAKRLAQCPLYVFDKGYVSLLFMHTIMHYLYVTGYCQSLLPVRPEFTYLTGWLPQGLAPVGDGWWLHLLQGVGSAEGTERSQSRSPGPILSKACGPARTSLFHENKGKGFLENPTFSQISLLAASVATHVSDESTFKWISADK